MNGHWEGSVVVAAKSSCGDASRRRDGITVGEVGHLDVLLDLFRFEVKFTLVEDWAPWTATTGTLSAPLKALSCKPYVADLVLQVVSGGLFIKVILCLVRAMITTSVVESGRTCRRSMLSPINSIYQ